MPSACGPDCSTLHKQKEFAAGALTKDQHLVQAIAPHRANQTLHIRILPWRSGRNRSIADAHGPHPGPEDMSVGTVRRRWCPGEGLGDLSRQPLGCRMSRHLEPQQVLTVVA